MEHVCALCGSLRRGARGGGKAGHVIVLEPCRPDPTQPAAFTSTGLCAAECSPCGLRSRERRSGLWKEELTECEKRFTMKEVINAN